MSTATSKDNSKKLRDASGRFVKSGTKVEDTATKTTKITGAGQVLTEMSEEIELEKPLISFQVNNPLKRLLYWIKQIKQKQTTTFEFKIKVPLIALPVFLVVLGSAFTFFFNLGKSSQATDVFLTPTPEVVSPSPYLTSKVGTVKASFQVLSVVSQAHAADTLPGEHPDPTNTPIPTNTPTPTYTPTPTMTPTPTPNPYRYVLLDKEEKVTFLITPANFSMERYVNKRVLITGLFTPEKNTLLLQKKEDIEILP